MAPDLVAAFVEEFNTEMRNLAASAERETLAAKRALAEIERKLAAIVRAIEDGAQRRDSRQGFNLTLKAAAPWLGNLV